MDRYKKSRELHARALRVIPGGVNSPVRAFKSVGGDPPYMVKGQGSHLWDADGNEYIDYIGSWGPLILGHAHPLIVEAVEKANRDGSSFGACTPVEAELAEAVIEAFPSMGKVRFVSSGTEATMSAIRVARAFTKRKYIVKFEGCYHGHADSLLVKAGSGVATLGIPGSAGVLEEQAQFTLALPFNDRQAVVDAFEKFRTKIACVIVEPVVGNMGCVPPRAGYLEFLREITFRNHTVLIFDEVMTGFRLALGGAQQLYGIQPDMTTLGKIIGGGLPVGAYGGRAEIMEMIAPLGPVYQAGTLSGNPLAMAAGLATVRHLNANPEIYQQLEERTAKLVNAVLAIAKEKGVALTANHVGSMFTWFFQAGEVHGWETAARCDTEAFGRFHRAMLDRGIYLPPSQYEAIFLGVAHSGQDIEKTVAAARESL
ncbi:MAG TPA: glutamate-1-semialdehyde 2,1-aminomutase [Candidatus Saccharimonadales bacterium]|jgi:glutamate-1-semialdehyde 2,1-aminomutase|nr:glutamate-1-semialdehyde 2,1-aminomutase [Candidatus Saccharimonadales bacterium]